MNEAREIAEQIETDHWADHQICEAATLIRSQHTEIDRLKGYIEERDVMISQYAAEVERIRKYSNDVQGSFAIGQKQNEYLQVENQKLRDALIMCHTSLCYAAGLIDNTTTQEEIKIEIGREAARAALGETK